MSAVPAPASQPRAYSHLTPRYLVNRTRQLCYERAHPDDPWLTPAAIRLLEGLLSPADRGAEFGSGRSTLWFGARVCALTSVEHDERWHKAVTARLKDRGLGNVDYVLAPGDQPMERGGDSAYAKIALGFPDAVLDFALVDGHYRDYSAKFIMPKIRPGGLLIINNVNWYLPCRSKAPHSRTAALGPATEIWASVWRELAGWRTIWTSSGVWDTAIFIRPGERDLSMPTATPMRKLVRDAGNVLMCRATWGGSQNFLGARWVERIIDNAPARSRKRLALRFLSLSPHYFYARDVLAEDARNRRSRQVLAETLVAAHLTPTARVLDYGCGPGYLAAAVAREAAHVDAVDISRGVLACARALNGGPNITYLTPEEFGVSGGLVDVAYSFAVIQHLRTAVLKQVLGQLAAAVRPGGVLLLHFATAENGYRTEAQCLADDSQAGRVRLRYGLNCFARTPAEMVDLTRDCGFREAEVRPLSAIISLPDDDIPDQQLLMARRA